jgi:hypothetical protein
MSADELAALHAEHGDFPRRRRGFDGESAHRAIIHIGAILKEVRQKRIFVRKITAFVQVVV